MNPLPFALHAAFGAAAILACSQAHAVRDAVVNVQTTGSSAASADLSTLVVIADGSFGSASAAVTYYFEVTGPQIGTVVPIVISGDWGARAFGTGIATGQVTTGLDLPHGSFMRDLVFSCSESAPCAGGPYHIHEQVLAGYEWTLLFSASGNAGAAGTFSSLVDPVITVDPSFTQPWSIEFSPNLASVAPIPEPSTFASMLAGLLLLARGVRAWRRSEA
ncbi:MAG: hypothetical protein ABI641_00250 [Caldimonas sp.]